MISAIGPLPASQRLGGASPARGIFDAGLADQRVATRFEVFGFAGMNVLTLQNRVEESGEHYTITSDYATKGLASVFVNLTTHAEVRGRLIPGSAQPEWFRDDSRRNGAERRSHVDYRPDGAVDAAVTPALPQPLPMAAMRDTVDKPDRLPPAPAPARPHRKLHVDRTRLRRPPCLRSGVRRCRKPGAVAVRRPAILGNAIACHMTRRYPPDITDPEMDEGAREGTIWYARLVPGDLLVPVRMEMDTQLGIVVVIWPSCTARVSISR